MISENEFFRMKKFLILMVCTMIESDHLVVLKRIRKVVWRRSVISNHDDVVDGCSLESCNSIGEC